MSNIFTDNYGQKWQLLGNYEFAGDEGEKLYKWETIEPTLPAISPTFWLETSNSTKPDNKDWNQAIRFRYKLDLPNFPEMPSIIIYPKEDPFIIELPIPEFILNLLYTGIEPGLILEFMPVIITPRQLTYKFNMDIRQLLTDKFNTELKARDKIQQITNLSLQILDKVRRL